MLPASVVFGQAPASLSVREAYEAARSGEIILVDIRSAAEWADTGLPQGAVPLDVDATAFDVRLAGLRLDHPGKRIVLIDRTGAQAIAVAQKLAGPDGWLAEKLPVAAYP
ncbi:rhodanese-like domain-containing protein [Bosea sp. (in: a-proteobacteria)]|uniref:rhodanese-like domain-containing protein n=1 Tax=Bosea sp. (in: a-proteobacteria) TaxID=1871050 RepID=UPI001AC2AD00|nr:rhodanese-like domain-containing protein [Bosea sp. (in: a-proteobacteria)]MBN9441503.1 rhodanese-like domain-containing protein [Bosea sp. (in: a-proteobacteria)]